MLIQKNLSTKLLLQILISVILLTLFSSVTVLGATLSNGEIILDEQYTNGVGSYTLGANGNPQYVSGGYAKSTGTHLQFKLNTGVLSNLVSDYSSGSITIETRMKISLGGHVQFELMGDAASKFYANYVANTGEFLQQNPPNGSSYTSVSNNGGNKYFIPDSDPEKTTGWFKLWMVVDFANDTTTVYFNDTTRYQIFSGVSIDSLDRFEFYTADKSPICWDYVTIKAGTVTGNIPTSTVEPVSLLNQGEVIIDEQYNKIIGPFTKGTGGGTDAVWNTGGFAKSTGNHLQFKFDKALANIDTIYANSKITIESKMKLSQPTNTRNFEILSDATGFYAWHNTNVGKFSAVSPQGGTYTSVSPAGALAKSYYTPNSDPASEMGWFKMWMELDFLNNVTKIYFDDSSTVQTFTGIDISTLNRFEFYIANSTDTVYWDYVKVTAGAIQNIPSFNGVILKENFVTGVSDFATGATFVTGGYVKPQGTHLQFNFSGLLADVDTNFANKSITVETRMKFSSVTYAALELLGPGSQFLSWNQTYVENSTNKLIPISPVGIPSTSFKSSKIIGSNSFGTFTPNADPTSETGWLKVWMEIDFKNNVTSVYFNDKTSKQVFLGADVNQLDRFEWYIPTGATNPIFWDYVYIYETPVPTASGITFKDTNSNFISNLTKANIQAGITATSTINNSTSFSTGANAILAYYEDGRLVSLKQENLYFDASGSLNISNAIVGSGNFNSAKIKVFLFDNFVDVKPLTLPNETIIN